MVPVHGDWLSSQAGVRFAACRIRFRSPYFHFEILGCNIVFFGFCWRDWVLHFRHQLALHAPFFAGCVIRDLATDFGESELRQVGLYGRHFGYWKSLGVRERGNVGERFVGGPFDASLQ